MTPGTRIRRSSAASELLLDKIKKLDGHQKEYVQACEEVLQSLVPVFNEDPEWVNVMERLIEPERVIQFRVPWLDKDGKQQVNRGFRVQYSSVLGPYKGGLRFHPSVNLGVIKFLGFEQVFKNSLTTLPMGGGKGGCDFDPKGKTDAEVMRFCQAFMQELYRHIGPNTDVPAGDIGVGGREIGYMYGMYKKIRNCSEGILTGKGLEYGGSLIRPEATGYGAVYFCQEALKELKKTSLSGKFCVVSGSGNVAQYTIEKLLELGAVPLTMSDSNGSIYVPDGVTKELLAEVTDLKERRRDRLSALDVSKFKGVEYHAGKKAWEVVSRCHIAFPSATQNEINGAEAKMLVEKGCYCCVEGANMPSDPDAISVYQEQGENFIYCPGKAANAGGVAVSGLEMTQNSMRLPWSREEVDAKLQKIMRDIFFAAKNAAEKYGKSPTDLQLGANIAGFLKVATAMKAQGCV